MIHPVTGGRHLHPFSVTKPWSNLPHEKANLDTGASSGVNEWVGDSEDHVVQDVGQSNVVKT